MRCSTSGSSTRSSRGFGAAFEVRYADDAVLVFERKTTRSGCLRCWQSGWRNTACACTRTRRGWWSFADRRSRRGAARNVSAASRCWGSPTIGTLQEGAMGGEAQDGEGPIQPSAEGNWPMVPDSSALEATRPASGAESQAARTLRLLRNHRQRPALGRFRYEVERLWRKWLSRRSWSGRMSWERFTRLLNNYPLPAVRVVHSVYR